MFFQRCLIVAAFVLFASHPAGTQAGPPIVSPDGLWQLVDAIPFPREASPPTRFQGAILDLDLLHATLREARPEGTVLRGSGVVISIPMLDGSFPLVSVVSSPVLEPALQQQFPQIQTYAFEGVRNPAISGRLAVGPAMVYALMHTPEGLLRLDSVVTDQGIFHMSFFDRDRTDGANILDHPADEAPPPIPVPRIASLGLNDFQLAPLAIDTGPTLRTYRMTIGTTGQFYQARAIDNDPNNDDIEVLFSIGAEISNVNAVFEPELGVRILIAANTLDVLFDDPLGDPFNNFDTPCNLREAFRDYAKANLMDDDYDLGFLLATQAGGGSSGCAWYVVCLTTDDTLHKARGAGRIGNNGTSSITGLILHETGHQLGARHTYSGLAGGCDVPNFNPGSAYAPGSGTTIMSYFGICDSDNVDASLIGTGTYYHTRSFEEIADNVQNGSGSTCGTTQMTGNFPPTVDAGLDFTIPRQTPFVLTGDAMDDEPMTFTWEQFDAAATRRAIDTDDGLGPIIRSVPPTISMSRTIPNLADILSGTTRKGEILPVTDRTLTFRFTARDNRMGGGGVAFDTMEVTVAGDPFFVTEPNGGETWMAGCVAPVEWEKGGGIAATVNLLASGDGGLNFSTLVSGTPNDEAQNVTVPCDPTTQARVKAEAADNIYFDISDGDFTIESDAPEVTPSAQGGEVDDECEFTVYYEATVTDDCSVLADDVSVLVSELTGNAMLGAPSTNIQQVNGTTVGVSGSVLVSDLTASPATVRLQVTAVDGCGVQTVQFADADVVDTTPPTIDVELTPDVLWPPNHKMVDITANVTVEDNCPVTSFQLLSVVSDEPDDAQGGGDGLTVNDIQGADVGADDVSFQLRAERQGAAAGRTYTATYEVEDGSGNTAMDSDTVEVPHERP